MVLCNNIIKNDAQENIVMWKENNIKDGFVIVDETELTKLIKRESIDKYYKLEQEPFAKGLFTSVRRCQCLETGESYAAKFTSRQRYGEDCSTEIYHEIALLSLCGSAPRVIQIHDVFENPNEIIIVMEYAPGGDLQTIIDEELIPFESDVVSYIRQTAEGLDYLHRRKIAHLDIKPQNIVMMSDYPNCEIKLCDFEISRVILEGKIIRELLGTPDYVAPEILHYDPITLAADMWSLGVTTYVLLTGYSPFGGETDQETFCNISRGELDFPKDLFKDVSNDAVDFIKKLIVKNPKARLTASACLKHPWLNNSNEQQHQQIQNKIDNSKEMLIKTEVVPQNDDVQLNVNEEKKKDEYIDGGGGGGGVSDQQQEDKNNKKLRKYLSKSREALFDKVVQKHNNNTSSSSNFKKYTFKNHRFRKTRMCESQISLISKSQEKLLTGGETLNAPSRSIEKLYGLRSLSKSQEVLNLYKTGGLLTSRENLNLVSEIIKSRENLVESQEDSKDTTKYRKLMRATTADLGVLHQKTQPSRMDSYSSTTSLASFSTNLAEYEGEDDDDDDEEYDEDVIDYKETVFESVPTCQKKLLPYENYKSDHRHTRDTTDIYNPVMREIEKLEKQKIYNKKIEETEDEDEPRFTVAQLVTAFNKHQEIVTKTSLEVTMSAHEKKVKIPEIVPYESQSSFPTGPKALRLFIPDIDLVSVPKKFIPKYKIKLREDEKKKTPKSPDDYDILRLFPSAPESPQSNKNYSSTEDFFSIGQRENNKKYLQKYNNDNNNSNNHQQEKEKIYCSVVTQRRNSKTSNPIIETNNKILDSPKSDDFIKKRSPTPNRKVGIVRSVERSPTVTRKSFTVEKSPLTQRKTTTTTTTTTTSTPTSRSFLSKQDDYYHHYHHKKENTSSSNYKIVGIGEKNPTNKTTSSVSYKIEFDSPVVKRKFPIKNNLLVKGTISSNLKVRETVSRARK